LARLFYFAKILDTELMPNTPCSNTSKASNRLFGRILERLRPVARQLFEASQGCAPPAVRKRRGA
jgi:hypothetical protein